ncbi:MAG: hypothetical protein E7057_05200 [Lentisphaerae bacterium]|nr:hypothetical protein [Lentisphaerota bacterium]
MAQELLYTSVPRGITPGSSGFCTAGCTRNIDSRLKVLLESLSYYKNCYPHYSAEAVLNPVSFVHLTCNTANQHTHILSRIAFYGVDYTGRSNKLAHHIVLNDHETHPVSGGPSALFQVPGFFRESWGQEAGFFAAPPHIPAVHAENKVAETWAAYTGDAGWAGVLAHSFLQDRTKPFYIIFDPAKHRNILALVNEALLLLEPPLRWEVTFNTYFITSPPGMNCLWRFCTADNEIMQAAIRNPGTRVIDLSQQLPNAGSGGLIDKARNGTPVIPLVPVVKPVRNDCGRKQEKDFSPIRILENNTRELIIYTAILIILLLTALALWLFVPDKDKKRSSGSSYGETAEEEMETAEEEIKVPAAVEEPEKTVVPPVKKEPEKAAVPLEKEPEKQVKTAVPPMEKESGKAMKKTVSPQTPVKTVVEVAPLIPEKRPVVEVAPLIPEKKPVKEPAAVTLPEVKEKKIVEPAPAENKPQKNIKPAPAENKPQKNIKPAPAPDPTAYRAADLYKFEKLKNFSSGKISFTITDLEPDEKICGVFLQDRTDMFKGQKLADGSADIYARFLKLDQRGNKIELEWLDGESGYINAFVTTKKRLISVLEVKVTVSDSGVRTSIDHCINSRLSFAGDISVKFFERLLKHRDYKEKLYSNACSLLMPGDHAGKNSLAELKELSWKNYKTAVDEANKKSGKLNKEEWGKLRKKLVSGLPVQKMKEWKNLLTPDQYSRLFRNIKFLRNADYTLDDLKMLPGKLNDASLRLIWQNGLTTIIYQGDKNE